MASILFQVNIQLVTFKLWKKLPLTGALRCSHPWRANLQLADQSLTDLVDIMVAKHSVEQRVEVIEQVHHLDGVAEG